MAIHVDVYTRLHDRDIRRDADHLNREYRRAGRDAGRDFGDQFGRGLERSARQVERSSQKLQRSQDKVADSLGRLNVERERHNNLIRDGEQDRAKLVAAAERSAAAQRKYEAAVRDASRAQQEHNSIVRESVRVHRDHDAAVARMQQASSYAASSMSTDWDKVRTDLVRTGAVFRALGSVGTPVGLVGIGAALVEIAGVAASAAQSLWLVPAAAGAGAAALGTLKIATLGFGDAMKDIRDPEKFAEALQKLSPNAQQAALSINALLPAFDQLKNATQDALFQGIGRQLNQLTTEYLPMVQNMTTGISGAFNDMFMGVTDQLMTPETQSSMREFMTNVTNAFRELAPAVAPLTKAFADIMKVGSGFLPELASAAADAAQSFSQFITEASKSGDLKRWLAEGLDTVRQLMQGAWALGEAFMSLAPIGQKLLPHMITMLEGIRDIMPVIGAAAVGLGPSFGVWMTAVNSVKGSVDLLSDAFRGIKAVVKGVGFAIAPMLDNIKKMIDAAMGPLDELLSLAAQVLGTNIVGGEAVRGPRDDLPLPSSNLPAAPRPGAGGGGGGPTDSFYEDWYPRSDRFQIPGFPDSDYPVPAPTGSGSGLPGSPQIPLPPEFGQPPRPGESVESWRARMNLIESKHDVAEKEARLHQLESDNNATENDVIKARNDLIESRMQVTAAERKAAEQEAKVQVPLPAELGRGPRQGESVESWRHRMDVIEARHDVAQKGALLNQLEESNTASEDEIIKARHEYIEAQAKLNDVTTKQLDQTTSALGEFGAELDKDFGISDGLAGIAENVTKFLANLAFAPTLGALSAVREADPRKGGHGLIGMAGAQGAFGPRFTGMQQQQQSFGFSPSAMGPAALQPRQTTGRASTSGMSGYPGDEALLSNVPSGRYEQTQAADLTQGLGDCSSAVEDLVNILDGRSTGGRSMSTHNAAEWLQQRGFVPGAGGAGDFRVGFNSGHMQATLPGGTPFNWGSDSSAARRGIGGSGASDPSFTSQFHRPVGGSPSRTTSRPSSAGIGSGAGIPGMAGPPAASPTQIGAAVAPPSGSGGGGGSLGMTSGGTLDTAMGVAASGLDLMAPGAGQAAQTGAKLANRAIQFGGEAAGIGVEGLMQTLLPTGGSDLAQNSWLTRIAGGLAGAAPALPNMAGQSPSPEQVEGVNPNTTQHGQAQGQQPGPANITVNNQRATEDGTGRDIEYHLNNMYSAPGM